MIFQQIIYTFSVKTAKTPPIARITLGFAPMFVPTNRDDTGWEDATIELCTSKSSINQHGAYSTL